MDLHKLAAERSLDFHRAIGDRLLQEPEILEIARRRVRDWIVLNPSRPFVRAWEKVLDGDTESVVRFITDRSELAAELRQSSPFAGVLRPRERWSIWRQTRQKLLEKK